MSRTRRDLLAHAVLPAAMAVPFTLAAVDPFARRDRDPGRSGPSPDAALVAMAAELRAIEATYNAGCGTSDEFCKSAEGEAMMERLETIIDQMAETPAEGLEGIAAKAGRLCFSLHPRSGGLMYCEEPLVESLAADLARLAPAAVGGAA